MSGVIFYLTILAASISAVCWAKPAEVFTQVPKEYPQDIKWVSHGDSKATNPVLRVSQVKHSAEVLSSRRQRQLNLVHINTEVTGNVPVNVDPAINYADVVLNRELLENENPSEELVRVIHDTQTNATVILSVTQNGLQNRNTGVEPISKRVDSKIDFNTPVAVNLVNSEEPFKKQPVIPQSRSSVPMNVEPISRTHLSSVEKIHSSDQDTEVIESLPPLYRDNETEIIDSIPYAEEHPQFTDFYPPKQPPYDINMTQPEEIQQPEPIYEYDEQYQPEDPYQPQHDYDPQPHPEEQEQPQYDYDPSHQPQYDHDLQPPPEQPQQPQYDYDVQPQPDGQHDYVQQEQQQPQYDYDHQNQPQQPQYDYDAQPQPEEPQQPQYEYDMQPQPEEPQQPQYEYDVQPQPDGQPDYVQQEQQPPQYDYDHQNQPQHDYDAQHQPEEPQQPQYEYDVQHQPEIPEQPQYDYDAQFQQEGQQQPQYDYHSQNQQPSYEYDTRSQPEEPQQRQSNYNLQSQQPQINYEHPERLYLPSPNVAKR